MSTDKKVTKDLIETLEDGKKGFAEAAERLSGTERPDLSPKFREFSEQRARFSAELDSMAARYGDDIDETGSAAATVHRGWMALRDVLSGDDPTGILEVAEQGEDHAVSEYEKALQQDISAELRTVVERQFAEVKSTHDLVKVARNSVAARS